MIRSLNAGVSGMQQNQSRLDVIGNNIANANTVGYKSTRTNFAEALGQKIQTSGGTGGQVGSGLATLGTQSNFSGGSMSSTSVKTDLAVRGDGFFVAKDSLSGKEFVTRAGDFKIDSSGYLVTNQGLRVQGDIRDTLGGAPTVGDIKFDKPAAAAATASIAGYSIGTDGVIKIRMTDNTEFTHGQILLKNFQDSQSLTREGFNLYSYTSAAGPMDIAAPLTNGYGEIQSGALEMSNVDLTSEFANMISTQRGFQACARVITTSDEILQELVNLKR